MPTRKPLYDALPFSIHIKQQDGERETRYGLEPTPPKKNIF